MNSLFRHRYRGKRTATHNLMVFESIMRGPHALAAGKHPCFRDYKWFYETGPGDPIAYYTTAKHHAINSLSLAGLGKHSTTDYDSDDNDMPHLAEASSSESESQADSDNGESKPRVFNSGFPR